MQYQNIAQLSAFWESKFGEDYCRLINGVGANGSFNDVPFDATYSRYVSQVQHENSLISLRLNVYLTISVLLFSGATLLIYLVHDMTWLDAFLTREGEIFLDKWIEEKHLPHVLAIAELQQVAIQKYHLYREYVDNQVRLLALLGLLVSVVVYIAISAAANAIQRLNNEYTALFVCYLWSKDTKAATIAGFYHYPQIVGAGSRRIALAGDMMPVLIPLLSASIWTVLLILGADPFGFSELLNFTVINPINEFILDISIYPVAVVLVYVLVTLTTEIPSNTSLVKLDELLLAKYG